MNKMLVAACFLLNFGLIITLQKDGNLMPRLEIDDTNFKKFDHTRIKEFFEPYKESSQHRLFMEVHKKEPNLELIRNLLSEGACPSLSENLLNTAVMSDKKTAVAQLLIKSRWPINTRNNMGETPLHTAAMFFNQNMIRMLVCEGADVNVQNNYRKTPLHYLLYLHKEKNIDEMKDLLIAHGADLQLSDDNGNKLCDLIDSE